MKILIIKLGALGDIIISMPVIQRILEHHQEDEVWLLTTPPFRRFFDGLSGLNLHVLPRGGLVKTWKQIRWVRHQHFDRIYDLQSNDRTAVICALSGCSWRAGNHPRFPTTYTRTQRSLDSAIHSHDST